MTDQKKPKQPRQPKQARSLKTRELLLEATVGCLVEDGISGFSTTRVTKKAGLARGAFSHHFGTREELLLAAIEHVLERTCDDLHARVSRIRSGPRRTERILEVIREAYLGDLFYAQSELWAVARTDRQMKEVCLEFGAKTMDRFSEIFCVAFGERAMTETDLPLLLFGRLLNMLRGMSTLAIVRGEKFLDPYWKYEKASLAREINEILKEVC